MAVQIRPKDVYYDGPDADGLYGYMATSVGGCVNVDIRYKLQTDFGGKGRNYIVCISTTGASYTSIGETIETPEAAKAWVNNLLKEIAKEIEKGI